MLQWMGGSRRKVTTSRKSTHKRQKQYFEQRKRQLQQQASGLESYSDGKRSCTLQCGNNRSLDILSLENLSTLTHKHRSSCINGDNSQHNDFTLNHQDAHPSMVILTNEVDQSEITEERTPPSYIKEDEYSEKVSVYLPDHDEDTAENHEKLDSLKLSPSRQISVIDLLGDDDGPYNNADENSLHTQEAHVAFSVEGLGKVEIKTPVHSPKITGRNFPHLLSSPKKARRQHVTAQHLDYGYHDLGPGVDIDFSPYDSSIDQPFCSRDVMDIFGNPKQEFINFRRPSPYNWNDSNLQGVSGNDDFTCNLRDTSRNIWNSPSFLDDDIDDLEESESFCKNQVDQRDIRFDDYFHCKDIWKKDLSFDGWDLQRKKSSKKRTESFHMKGAITENVNNQSRNFTQESPDPYPKHQTMHNLPGILFSDKMWCSSTEIDNAVNHFVREDTTESKSLLSEESCSSTAVRGDTTKKP